MEHDLIIIGGGPGGYTAALRAAQLGAKVILVEQHALGGTCLHWGCIPTKAFYKNAEIINTLKKAQEFGVDLLGFSLDMQKVQARKQEIVERLHSGLNQLMKIHGIQVLKGKARLLNPTTVEITPSSPDDIPEKITARYILLATGSRTADLPIPGTDLPGVLTSKEVLDLTTVPGRMVIIGGGVIGMELAAVFQSFGSEVTVLELLPRILPMMDEELVRRFNPLLKKKGLKIETGVRVKEIRQSADGLLIFAQGKNEAALEFNADIVLLATGRVPQTEGLGLAEAGVRYNRQGIEVDEDFATSVPGIYAIGDVIGGQMLAHVASHQGRIVAEKLFASRETKTGTNQTTQNPSVKKSTPVVPSCVFTFPEIAAVGLTEEEAKSQNIPYQVSKAMFGANGKALTLGEGEGLIKVLANKETGEILGVHILGPHASDLIHEAALSLHQGLKATDIQDMIHAHPTLAETFHEAILNFKF
ncbi:MAG TPA: dihydrolipoyl dehydrogenase [Peptococcaceae bacterium]|nr:dihydrolipoyl dehydrogenase [Peptococcaceae bacterium]